MPVFRRSAPRAAGAPYDIGGSARVSTAAPSVKGRWVNTRRRRPRADPDRTFPATRVASRSRKSPWDDWFPKFDESDLVLLHQETLADGTKSNFNKLTSRGRFHSAHDPTRIPGIGEETARLITQKSNLPES